MSTLQFLKPSYVEKDVNEVRIKFYAIPVTQLFMLRDVATPLLHSLVAIFKGNDGDNGRVIQDFEILGSGEKGAQTTIEPVALDIARYRDGVLKDSISKLIDGLSHDGTKVLLGGLIMSSLREEYPPVKGGFTREQITEFIDNPDLTVETLSMLVSGVLEASKGMLGPLAGPAAAAIKILKVRIAAVVAALEDHASAAVDQANLPVVSTPG